MTKSFQSPGSHWKIINILLIVGFVGSAFLVRKPIPGEFDTPAFGIAFCVVAIVLLPVITIIWLYFVKAPLRAPAWNRSPFRSDDPLQPVFLGPWFAFGVWLGALSLVPRFGIAYIWTAVGWGGIFIGFVISRFLAFRLYRDRIVSI